LVTQPFDEGDAVQIALSIIKLGDLSYNSAGRACFSIGREQVVHTAQGDFFVRYYVGDREVTRRIRDFNLVSAMQDRLGDEPEVLGSAFSQRDAEMIRHSMDLAKALDITPTAAQRLIEMRTEYRPPRELE